MKKMIFLASIIGVLSIASLSFAQQVVTFPGSTCKPLYPSIISGFTYSPNFITNTGAQNIRVACPLARVFSGSNTASILLKATNVSVCRVVSNAVFSGAISFAPISPNGTPVNVYAPSDAVLSVTCTLNAWGGRIEGIGVLLP